MSQEFKVAKWWKRGELRLKNSTYLNKNLAICYHNSEKHPERKQNGNRKIQKWAVSTPSTNTLLYFWKNKKKLTF